MLALAAGILAAGRLVGAERKTEEPAGVILRARDAQLHRSIANLPIAAKDGDLLFTGDRVRSGSSGAVEFLHCPSMMRATLAAGAEMAVEAGGVKLAAGALTGTRSAAHCKLPKVEREGVVTSRMYGAEMVRGVGEARAAPGDYASRLARLPAARRAQLLQELEPLERALQQDPADQAARLARAVVLRNFDLTEDAAEEYRRIAAEWKEAAWPRAIVHELEDVMARRGQAEEAPGREGKVYAVLVGVSRYRYLPAPQQLQFAHADARLFYDYLKSTRGGGLPPENIQMLADEQATTAAVRNAIVTFFKARAGRQDRVILFIAAHGTVERDGGAYIVSHDSDPQDLKTTALPMVEIQRLMDEQLPGVGRLDFYVDVCRAGTIGTIRSDTVNRSVETMLEVKEPQGEVFGLLASRPGEFSFEGPRFGGGHGAFSYFLIRGLNGEADANNDAVINIDEIIEYVRGKVREATRRQQTPRENGRFNKESPVVRDTRQPGIELAGWTMAPEAVEVADVRRGFDPGVEDEVRSYEAAIARGDILPERPDSAFIHLGRLRSALGARSASVLRLENLLRVALQNRGQSVLLRYLSGDQTPQTREDFSNGASYYAAALRLNPDADALESRALFCRGRAMLFDRNYAEAVALLERAVRLDSGGSYAYNALGIAYLEQADYRRASPAFQDAIQRAPSWAYPRHNLALAYTELGDYEAARRSYEEAIRLAPQYSYLPYNLGLVEQRLNRGRAAESSFRKALALDPKQPEPYNALGYLMAARGNSKEAEHLYRQALGLRPGFLEARHNLGLLLAGDKNRTAEAVECWRENLRLKPDFLPSRVSLAETLVRLNTTSEALGEYQALLALRPDYTAGRLELAALLAKSGQTDEARRHVREALGRKPASALVLERLGDVESAAGNHAEARRAYSEALGAARDPEMTRRLKTKLKVSRAAGA
jgi:tetratricopeptide (TPR) repeat protein